MSDQIWEKVIESVVVLGLAYYIGYLKLKAGQVSVANQLDDVKIQTQNAAVYSSNAEKKLSAHSEIVDSKLDSLKRGQKDHGDALDGLHHEMNSMMDALVAAASLAGETKGRAAQKADDAAKSLPPEIHSSPSRNP